MTKMFKEIEHLGPDGNGHRVAVDRMCKLVRCAAEETVAIKPEGQEGCEVCDRIELWEDTSAGGLVITDGIIYHTDLEYAHASFREDAAGWGDWATVEHQDHMTLDASCIEPRCTAVLLKDTWDEHLVGDGWRLAATYADGIVTLVSPGVVGGASLRQYLGDDHPGNWE